MGRNPPRLSRLPSGLATLFRRHLDRASLAPLQAALSPQLHGSRILPRCRFFLRGADGLPGRQLRDLGGDLVDVERLRLGSGFFLHAAIIADGAKENKMRERSSNRFALVSCTNLAYYSSAKCYQGPCGKKSCMGLSFTFSDAYNLGSGVPGQEVALRNCTSPLSARINAHLMLRKQSRTRYRYAHLPCGRESLA